MRPRSAVLGSIFVGASLLVAPASARADDEVVEPEACAAHAETAQRERQAGNIENARDELVACSKPECPAIVRRDCERWFVETEAQAPAAIYVPERPQPASAPAESASSPTRTILGWSLLGAGTLGASIGLYFSIKTFSSPCANAGVCTRDERDTASTAGALGTTGFLAGVVLVTGGIIALMTR